MTSFRNQLIFGKLFFAVASFLNNSIKVDVSTPSGIILSLSCLTQINPAVRILDLWRAWGVGLTCDPIFGLVQVPCIERNAFAAVKAITCADYALLTDGRHLISFDKVVETMQKTGQDMLSFYRETSLGGLALSYLSDGASENILTRGSMLLIT